jgi:hypothetical protein
MTNPTSNFGWQMPEATDLVTNLPADFEVFGQAVDTDFADLNGGTTGQVLSKTTSTDLDFTWVTPAAGMTNPMTTTGDIIYSSPGSTPVRLGIGSSGQVLNVASGVPAWATPAPSGKVLQVVSTVLDDTFSASSASFVDITGLSRAITPSSASSKILVMVQLSATPAYGVNRAMFRMVRDSTAINVGVINGSRVRATAGASPGNDTLIATSVMIFLDSPATTSSTTYKIQGIVPAGSGSFYVNRSYTWNDDGNATYTSTITCMEIGA